MASEQITPIEADSWTRTTPGRYARGDGHTIRKEPDRAWWLVYDPTGALIPSAFGGVLGGPTLWWAKLAVANEVDEADSEPKETRAR